MTIKTTAWHYRVYQYWARFSPTYKEGYRENLCHYVRVLLFWAPWLWTWRLLARAERFWKKLGVVLGISLAALLAVAVIGGVLFLVGAAIYLLVIAWPWSWGWGWLLDALLMVGLVVGVIAGATLALAAVVGMAALIGNMLRDRKPPEIPGTVKLAAAYVMARKRRVCPFITFDEGAPSRS